MSLIAIAAVAKNGVIGENGSLPWNIPEDLRRFKSVTMGHPIIMGYNTFVSIGCRPLHGRNSIVLTRHPGREIPGVWYARSPEEAKFLAGYETAFVIGGQQVFEAMLPMCNRMLLTEIQRDYPGNVFFPKFDRSQWREVSREKREMGVLSDSHWNKDSTISAALEILEYHFVEYSYVHPNKFDFT